MDLSQRADLSEQMDNPDLDPETYIRCLRDLAAVNQTTLTHQPTLRWLHRATRGWRRGAAISVLDIGYGQGDLLRAIARWARRRGFSARLSGVDLNPRSAVAALTATPPELDIDYRSGDVFTYEPAQPPDFIVSSQFTHHLPGPDIIRLLRWCEAHAVRGWHIADLHRHALAYYSYPLLARVMAWHRIVREDGAVSIARGFNRREWEAMLAQVGLPARIAWHPMFRFGIGRLK